MRSIVSQTAASFLPAGFAEFFTDLLTAGDHATSVSGAATVAPVNTESGGKRRLSTATSIAVAEILPASAANILPLMINPKTSQWYVEGRAAIETHAATSLILPASIARTAGGAMVGPPTSDTVCALGHAGSNFSGGNNSFLSFVAISAGTMALQTTTIPWTSTIKAYGLAFDGSTIYALVDGVVQWTTTNLTQIFSGSEGFHCNQWLYCSDTAATTMLCDSLYGAGPRI